MSVKLYKLDLSPPARATMMACDIFNVPVELIDVNLMAKEHLTPEFLKKNPLHTIPVLEKGNLILHDSHAILAYLADAYGKDDTWYPKDIEKRALVNQKLFFDTSILFPRLRNITYALVIEGARTVQPKQLSDIEEAFTFLEDFLSRTKYLAGDQVTIADVSAISNVTSLVGLVPLDEKKLPKLAAWVKEITGKSFCKKFNESGAAGLRQIIKERLGTQ